MCFFTSILQSLRGLYPPDDAGSPFSYVTVGSQQGRSACVSAEGARVASLNLPDNHLVIFLDLFIIDSAEIFLVLFRIGSVMACPDVSELLVHERNAFPCQFTL